MKGLRQALLIPAPLHGSVAAGEQLVGGVVIRDPRL